MLITELSTEARVLADRLAEVPHGELIPLSAISETLGRDITRCRHILYSALKVVQRETGASFAVERGKGYRRLGAEDAPATIGNATRARIRNQARRGGAAIRSAVAHSNNLSPDVARRANAEMNALGLLEHIARDRNVTQAAKTADRPATVAEAGRDFLARIGAIQSGGANAAPA